MTKRAKERAKTKLNAQYFIKKYSSRYLECQVVNLSSSGAAVSVSIDEKPERDAAMFLDVFIPKTLLHVSVVGAIKRIERRNNELIIGVKFTELISRIMFQQLTGNARP